jgi:hypothetical protein
MAFHMFFEPWKFRSCLCLFHNYYINLLFQLCELWFYLQFKSFQIYVTRPNLWIFKKASFSKLQFLVNKNILVCWVKKLTLIIGLWK